MHGTTFSFRGSNQLKKGKMEGVRHKSCNTSESWHISTVRVLACASMKNHSNTVRESRMSRKHSVVHLGQDAHARHQQQRNLKLSQSQALEVAKVYPMLVRTH